MVSFKLQQDYKNTRLSIHLQGLPKIVLFRQIVRFHLMLVVYGFLIDVCSLKIFMSDMYIYTVLLLRCYHMQELLYAENSLVGTVF